MSYSRISTGEIILKKRKKVRIVTVKVIGEIEKVIIKFSDKLTNEINIVITTSDGEEILNIVDNKNSIYYPRNWNVMNQKYTGISIAPPNSSPTNEKYVSDGSLFILVEGSGEEDLIHDIEILVKGEIEVVPKKELEKSILKSDAPVTTSTTGVSNTRFGIRRRILERYMQKVLREIIEKEKVSLSIEKQTKGVKEMVESINTNLYDKKFEGFTVAASNSIKEYLVTALKNGYSMSRITKHIMRKGGSSITIVKAEMIARTEIQALQNTVREWSYKKLDPKLEFKYKWLGPNDDRTTKICRTIKSRTSKGVSLNKLREIVKEESIKGGFDGSREWTPHIFCRHSFVRSFN